MAKTKGQSTQTRQQQIINYTPNGLVVSNKLTLGTLYREMMLTLRGTLSNAESFNYGSAQLAPGDEWNLIKKLEIIANSNVVLRTFTGEELANYNQFVYGRPRRLMPAQSSTQSFNSTVIVPFWDHRSVKPIDTLLNTATLTDLRVNVTWGNQNSVFDSTVNGPTTNAFTVAPTLVASTRESFGLQGRFSVIQQSRILNGSPLGIQLGYTQQLPLGNIYKGFLIYAKDSDGHDIDLTTVISNIYLVSGPTTFLQADIGVVRDWQNLRWQNLITQFVGSAAADVDGMPNFAVSQFADPKAWLYLNLVDDGFVTEAIDTYGMSEFKLQFDITGSIQTLGILPEILIPVRGGTTKKGR